jgi:hydrogenase expression/formation protein HypC
MCLALPGQIIAVNGLEATVLVGGAPRRAGLQLHPQAAPGDFVLIKTGLVVEVLPEDEARELMAFFDEMVSLLEETAATPGEPITSDGGDR